MPVCSHGTLNVSSQIHQSSWVREKLLGFTQHSQRAIIHARSRKPLRRGKRLSARIGIRGRQVHYYDRDRPPGAGRKAAGTSAQ